jgi:tRNA(adenine34) deaminase
MTTDEDYMKEALRLSEQADALNEVPVGAVVVINGEVVGRGFNRPISTDDPTAHAEIEAIRDAAKRLGNYRLADAELFVTVEPCTMCAGAIVHSRIKRVVFGTVEPKAGAVCSQHQLFSEPWINHQPSYTKGILAEECATRVSAFFRRRREEKKAARRSNYVTSEGRTER